MRRNEAFETLGLTESASEDEIKKAFRSLAAANHPDKNNGSKESEEKFKKINQAHQIIIGKEQAEDDRQNFNTNTHYSNGMGINIEDIFNAMHGNGEGSPFDAFFGGQGQQRQQHRLDLSPISIYCKLTFEESILGSDKRISFDKKNYCVPCDGLGKSKQNARKCNKCNGTGAIKQKVGQGMMVIIQTHMCPTCNGTGVQGEPCNDCSGKGFNTETISLNVKIPPVGSQELSLAMNGKGHSFKNQAGDVLLHLSPTTNGEGKYKDMRIEGRDIYTHACVNLDILLFGGTIKVPVVGSDNDQEIAIPALTKPEEQFFVNSFGARQYGNLPLGKQVVIVKSNYPSRDKLSKELLEELKKVYSDV